MVKIGIIGAGPIGLTMFRLAEVYGHEAQIFERGSSYSTLPKAHYLQNRALEIFKEIGISDFIYEKTPKLDTWRNFVYWKHLGGKIYRIHDHFRGPRWERIQQLTNTQSANLSQDRLTQILHVPQVKFNHTLTSFKETEDGVCATFGNGKYINFDYLVGCDGASSLVRSASGIPMVGDQHLFKLFNIWFRSKELCKLTPPAMLTLIFNPQQASVLVYHYDDLFVLQIPYYENLQTETDPSTLIAQAFQEGRVPKDVQIINSGSWLMSGTATPRLQQGRVFLAGDAAHVLPPSGAFNMNLGIQDVHNLAWKLAHPDLLPTYTQERVQHVQRVLATSMVNFRATRDISAKAFGVSPQAGEFLNAAANLLPTPKLLAPLARLREVVWNDWNAETYLADDRKLLHLLFPDEDLSIQYEAGWFKDGHGGLVPVFNLPNGRSSRDIASGQLGLTLIQGRKSLSTEGLTVSQIVKADLEESYLIRPDAHVFNSTKSK